MLPSLVMFQFKYHIEVLQKSSVPVWLCSCNMNKQVESAEGHFRCILHQVLHDCLDTKHFYIWRLMPPNTSHCQDSLESKSKQSKLTAPREEIKSNKCAQCSLFAVSSLALVQCLNFFIPFHLQPK